MAEKKTTNTEAKATVKKESKVKAPKTVEITEEQFEEREEVDEVPEGTEIFDAAVVVDSYEETTKEDVIEAVEKLGETVQEIVSEVETPEEETETVEEIQNEVNELVSGKEELNDKLEKEPEKAETFIKAEIKKAEALKEKVEKAIKRSNLDFTNSWNGQTYDF